MSDKIRHAIECWASRPTWFSSHPMDVKELRQAIRNLKKNITASDFTRNKRSDSFLCRCCTDSIRHPLRFITSSP